MDSLGIWCTDMSQAYGELAPFYDSFMEETPYDDWARFITGYLRERGIEDGLILDLGCGTGEMTGRLKVAGYDMTGVDCSGEMLSIAAQKDPDSLYLCQDMRELELYGTVRAAVSVCDCLNYILEEEDLLRIFSLVNNYLDAGGYFIFDLNTPFKYRELLGDNTFAFENEDAVCIWDNCFDDESGINEYALTLFIKNDEGLFVRKREEHYERCYCLEKIKELLQRAGMEFVEAFAGYDGSAIAPGETEGECDRMVIVARELPQRGKKYTDE